MLNLILKVGTFHIRKQPVIELMDDLHASSAGVGTCCNWRGIVVLPHSDFFYRNIFNQSWALSVFLNFFINKKPTPSQFN